MKKISPLLLIIGLIMVAAGIVMPVLTKDISNNTFRYVYAAGAGLTLIARLFGPTVPAGTPLKLKRLLHMESWSSIMYCVAAFFAFYAAPQVRDWLAFTLAGAAIQVYCSIAISLLQRKKKK